MPRATPLRIYKAFMFHVDFGPSRERDALWRLGALGRSWASAVWSNPFAPDELWLAQGHIADQPTLFDMAEDEGALARAEKRPRYVSVWMHRDASMGDADGPSRLITASFTSCRWLPFDLDAAKSETATEWLVLEGVVYRRPE